MLLGLSLVFATLPVGLLAAPFNSSLQYTPSLAIRAEPSITPDVYTAQQVEQFQEGHKDAIMLASTVVSWPDTPDWFDPIFTKYFNIEDRQTVIDVFKKIIEPNDGDGNDLLANIKLVRDYVDRRDFKFACHETDDETYAELRDFTLDNAKLILCPRLFEVGVIGKKSWPGAQGITCNTLYPRISWKMETFGHMLLHENTHWNKFLSPIMKGPFGFDGTEDVPFGSGPYNVRRLSRNNARINGDSYAWLATEVWWTQTCHSSHGNFEEPEKQDNAID